MKTRRKTTAKSVPSARKSGVEPHRSGQGNSRQIVSNRAQRQMQQEHFPQTRRKQIVEGDGA